MDSRAESVLFAERDAADGTEEWTFEGGLNRQMPK